MAQKPKVDTFTREFRQDAPLAVDDRTVSLAFSSTEPYQRAWYDESSGRSIIVNEVLDHESRSVDLTRLKSGAPLLRDHDIRAHIGAVVSDSISIDGNRGRAKVKFSRTPPGEAALMDVNDDILRSVSVAYRVLKTKLEDKEAPVPTLRVTKWQPYEISLVAVPADSTVGVGRNMEEPEMNDETTVAAPDKTASRAATPQAPAVVTEPVNIEAEVEKRAAKQVAEQLERINKINGTADRFKDRIPDIKARAKAAIDSKEPAHVFGEWVLSQLGSRAQASNVSPTIGLSQRELERYSLVEAIRGICMGDRKIIDKYGDMTRAAAKAGGIDATSERGFLIPQDVMDRADPEMAQQLRNTGKRALAAETGSTGGYLVGTEVLTGSMVELLRNASALNNLPATRLTGLTGNVDIPTQTGGATAYWLSETASVTRSDQAFGQIALTPKRVSGATAFSRQLIAQTTLSVEAMVRQDLATVIALSKDLKYLQGAGGAGEPLGLINVSGIGAAPTYSGAATFAALTLHESTVETTGVVLSTPAFIISPAAKAKWRTIPLVSGVARFLWEDGMAAGYPVVVSQHVPSNRSIFGNWSDFVIAEWAAMEVIVDPYSLSLANQISLVLVSHTDCAVRHAESFTVSTDTAAA